MVRHVGSEQLNLMRRVQARDQQALGTLYDLLSPLVNAVVLRILSDTAETEEVLVETFWQVWNGAASYDAARGTVEGWVITMARSRALDRLRARKRQDAGTASHWEEERLAAATHPTPESVALQGEQARAVAAALDTLPAEQRLPIELAYYQGLSQTEIAQRLEQPLGTVKTRLRLGLLRLRHVLQPHLGARA
jgi:RNA polymerase sigma-70 factor (ECF subfamily)